MSCAGAIWLGSGLAEVGIHVRACAARTVAAVRSGNSLNVALAEQQQQLSAADRALVAALAYGVLRDYRLLSGLAGQLFKQPPKAGIHALVLVGLHQLRCMRIPQHAAVHATVGAVSELGQSRARGLVNAVLRRYQREAESLEAAVPDNPGVRTSHPDWLVKQLRADWPQHWRQLLAANNTQAPMTLRVNARQYQTDAYQKRLAAAGLTAHAVEHAPRALRLDKPTAVDNLPEFASGAVSVQDAAAQLAASLLETSHGMRVLDACAAPGGKAAHCLELTDCECELLALDSDASRLRDVDATFQRLGLSARTQHADAADPDSWWDGQPFDRILLDAPCSGTGVIRRHPDIKWLRRPSDIEQLVERQRQLLDALWPLLAPGGMLVYATCSTLRAEGSDVVCGFLATAADAREQVIDTDWGMAEAVGRRLPGQDNMDGFYYARLCKVD